MIAGRRCGAATTGGPQTEATTGGPVAGTPIEARCTFTVAPQTLVFGKPDAECSADEIGTAAGLDD